MLQFNLLLLNPVGYPTGKLLGDGMKIKIPVTIMTLRVGCVEALVITTWEFVIS